ncbi:hypothetical protein ACNHYB_06145 [Isoptericola jiangsuensis]|uniref:hypothetical protein n=1 Tax=Isoptericola jiangsuensis TaxID=548579 RepID=UPI003AACCE87
MSNVKMVVIAVVTLVVIAAGVGIGVTVALDHRDKKQAEAAAVALAAAEEEAAAEAEAAAAAEEEARDQECAALTEGYIDENLSTYVDHGPDYEAGDFRFGENGANLIARYTAEWAGENLVPLDCADDYYVDLFIAAKAEADAYIEVNAPSAKELAPEYAALIGH